MNALPDMHDGFFEGVFASKSKMAHLYFRSYDGKSSTVVLGEVERMDISSFKDGNIVFDIVLVDSDDLSVEHMERLYEPSNPENNGQRLIQAREKGLRVLEVNPSYGAECTALFRSIEVLAGHIWPTAS